MLGGVGMAALFLYCFFKTRALYEQRGDYVVEKVKVPAAKHDAMMSTDPLMRNPTTWLQFRACSDSAFALDKMPPAPRYKRQLPVNPGEVKVKIPAGQLHSAPGNTEGEFAHDDCIATSSV